MKMVVLWVKYQDPEEKLKWSIWIPKGNIINKPIYEEKVFTIYNTYTNYSNPIITFPKPFVSKNSHKRTNKRKK